MRWVKRAVLALVTLGIVAFVVMAMAPKPVPVETARAVRGPMQVVVEEDGATRVRNRYVLTAPVAGNLARISLRAGDRVEAGTVVARIAPIDAPLLDARSREQTQAQHLAAVAAMHRAQALAEEAKVALAHAETELARVRSLMTGGAVTQAVLDRAETEARARQKEVEAATLGVRVARHEVDMARAASSRAARKPGSEAEILEVRAPIDGAVLRVHQESASVIAPGSPLIELGDLDSLEVVVDVLTSDAVRVRPDAEVMLKRWGGDQPLSGRVRRVEPSAFTKVSALGVEEQRVLVLVDPAPPSEAWKRLGDGYRVEAAIVVWSADQVLNVPSGAVYRTGDRWAVFAVEKDRAVERMVEIGHRTGFEVEVTSGLDDGTVVVLHPSDQVANGTRVELATGG